MNSVERVEDRRNEDKEILQSVRRCSDEYDSKGLIGEWLLMPKVAIHRDKHVELSTGAAKQLPVFNTTPAATQDRFYVVRNEVVGKADRNVFIK